MFCLPHNNENNEIIFNILKSEDRNFYHHTDIVKLDLIGDIDKYTDNGKIFFDIFYKNELVGLIDINPNNYYLSYWITTKFQNLGITSKVLKKLSDMLLDIGVLKIFVHIKEENIASIRVAEKSGFVLEERKVFDGDDAMLLFVKK